MSPLALLVGLALETGALSGEGDGAEHTRGLACQNTNPIHESDKVVGKGENERKEKWEVIDGVKPNDGARIKRGCRGSQVEEMKS
ncbi:hypothetical protein CgunFtcFv8_015436 [Champsocephalus gunnari]|uniref:Secreted protein n=1 Tax=Champsocephalus gunnari TaxID=52237 RepID=A0AAN8C9G7_CHAGU|nr:hypothetical protein CgunFtcFv8_015436 [Champsocephalus gunnari]